MATTDPGAAVNARLHSRVRRAMYLAFAALAALAAIQAVYGHRFERVRAADAEIISIAGTQHTFTQQMGRMAALAGDANASRVHANLLHEALDRSRADALLVEALIDEQARLSDDDMSDVVVAQAIWQLARERLWRRCEDLLDRQQTDADGIAEAAAAVQREVEPALGAASTLTKRLQAAARLRSERQVHLLEAGVGLTLGLLALLAATVVEPTARAVRGQVQMLADQTRQIRRLALVATRTHNMVVVSDGQRGIEWINDAFTRRTGWTLPEIRGAHLSVLLSSPNADPADGQRIQQALATDAGVRIETLARDRNGAEFWIDADVQPLRGDDGVVRGYVTLGTDISERRAMQEQLRAAARSDALTGLPNRAVVLDRLQRAIDHAARHPGYAFAVLFMDFDRFKQVNDTLGHGAGDELLRRIARRIEDTLRPGDAVARVASALRTAARIGGDEFVVVLEGVQPDEARTVAERLLAALAEPYTIHGQAVQSSVSIGIVAGGDGQPPGLQADDVLRDADTAMYEAKRGGRGRCVVFDGSMHERVVAALALESDLRAALRDGELFVVYQPVVALGGMDLVGVEALVRWRHPTRGVVAPGVFIGLAEEAGLIDAIGREVLQQACRQFASWRRELGHRAPPQLAVNLSRAQLQSPALIAEVQAVLDQHGLEPAALQFEITESLAAQDERVQAALRELKALGVKLALDDFGTGYSSLACLHQMPVDTVKIDRSFVSHAETVEYHRVLIEATIHVAQALGMTTVAEGIETAGQAALMEKLRCDRGQGYLFGRPVPAAEFDVWLERHAEAGVPDAVDTA